MVNFLINHLVLLSVSLFAALVAANPVAEQNINGIMFDERCPNGETVCKNHPIDCLGGCALNASTGETVFQWERTIFTTKFDKASRVDIQAMKKCLGREAIRTALLKGQEDGQDSGSETLPCTVSGSEWQYIYPQYYISALTKPECDKTRSYLDKLTGSCQSWKNTVSEAGLWIGYGAAAVAGTAASYFAVAQVGRCTGWFHWVTLGDVLGACYRKFFKCGGYQSPGA
ncbi:hypothetical protein [Endozoicomonas sp. 4G]|uniref:hypothetical protein n=1 Tax=Endozoicomonas sp. 4G TaxID=2872754 RepID=UPI002078B20B|nr:hypothetical protein [Endozoicomonas sp. 4G]